MRARRVAGGVIALSLVLAGCSPQIEVGAGVDSRLADALTAGTLDEDALRLCDEAEPDTEHLAALDTDVEEVSTLIVPVAGLAPDTATLPDDPDAYVAVCISALVDAPSGADYVATWIADDGDASGLVTVWAE